MAFFKEGALELRRRNLNAPSDPGFIKVYCDVGGSLYTVDEYGTSAYIKGVANISTGVFGSSPTAYINSLEITITNFNVILNSNTDYSGTYNAYSVPQISKPIQDIHDVQYICCKIISGEPSLYVETNWNNINGSDSVCVYIIWKDLTDSSWNTMFVGSNGSGLPNKILQSIIETQSFRVVSNSKPKLSESNRIINVTSCDVYFGSTKIHVPAFSSDHSAMYELINNGTTWIHTPVTVYDNQYYNGETNKVSMGAGKYGVRWFYSMIDDISEVVYTLGLSAYNSVADAQMEDPPENLPDYISSRFLLVGRIIVGYNALSGLVEGAFGKFQFKPLTSNHNALNGLQGGQYGEFFHLTETQANQLTSGGFTNIHNHDYVYIQSTAATMWPINHNMNRIVGVTVYNNNQKVEPGVAYSDYNTVILSFSVPLSGIAILT